MSKNEAFNHLCAAFKHLMQYGKDDGERHVMRMANVEDQVHCLQRLPTFTLTLTLVQIDK